MRNEWIKVIKSKKEKESIIIIPNGVSREEIGKGNSCLVLNAKNDLCWATEVLKIIGLSKRDNINKITYEKEIALKLI